MARGKDISLRRTATRRRAPLRKPRRVVSLPSRASSSAGRAETLTEQAYRIIEEQIVTLRHKPGDILSEQMLSASSNIGRTPIREALQRLAREGLVTILPRKGILVSEINPRHQLLVLEVRRANAIVLIPLR